MTVKGMAGFLLLMMASLAHALPTDIQIKAAIPTDDPAPGNLVVGLNLYGKNLREIKGMRCILEKAVDTTGKNLISKDSDFAKTNQAWTPLVYDPTTPPGMQLILDLPAQQASMVKELTGRLEILTPVHDPLCVMNFTRIAAQLDVELADPNLIAAQITMVVSTKKANGKPSVVVRVSDPLAKLFYFEIVDANGKEWDAVADTMTTGTTTTYTYPGALPENANLRVCVPTPKAIITVPLSLKDIALPKKRHEKSKLVTNLEAGKQQTVVTYGTSLTAGGAWVGQLSSELKRHYSALPLVINSGRSSMWSKWGVDNLDTRVISKSPDTVFIEFTINDAFLKYDTSVPQARSNLLNMVDRVLAANKACEIILMVMNPPIGVHLTSRPNIELYNQMVRDVAAERRLMLIDHYPDWQKILTADPKQFSALVPDGIHPNAEGCKQIILPNILRALGVKTEATPAPSAPTSGVKQ
jgi:acyl-CoA thioesterase-1